MMTLLLKWAVPLWPEASQPSKPPPPGLPYPVALTSTLELPVTKLR